MARRPRMLPWTKHAAPRPPAVLPVLPTPPLRPMPISWALLADLWELTPAERQQCWTALCRSRWSTVKQWREALLLVDNTSAVHRRGAALVQFVLDTSPPSHVLAVLETLRHGLGHITVDTCGNLQFHGFLLA